MAASYPASPDLLRYDSHVTASRSSDCSWADGSLKVDAMTDEEQRAARLLDAQASAIALFDEVAARGLVAPARVCHWILEIHLTDTERQFGGFHEQLLDLG